MKGALTPGQTACLPSTRLIRTCRQFQTVSSRLLELMSKASLRTPSETRLMKLLAVLIEDYDRRNALPPDDSSPSERLRFLLEESGQPASVLTPVFGQRSHVNEALNGKRPISADQARKLGALFSVQPGLFV